MLKFFADNYLWFLMFVLIVNITQRKIPHTEKKRIATIYIASLLMIFNIAIVFILTKELNHNLAWLALALTILIGYFFRNRVWPFKFRCVKCGKKLTFNQVAGGDDNLCEACLDEKYPKEAEERKEKEQAKQVVTEEEVFVCPDTVEEMDWDAWDPEEHCVIAYVVKDDKVLLINKKQGLGKGLVNGPGGHIELEETAIEAVHREFKEETGLTSGPLNFVGTLNFQFKDGLSMIGHVYIGNEAEGELIESEETTPFWCDKNSLPYDQMWEDDILWLPRALEGEKFNGYFIFDEEKMLSSLVKFEKIEE